MVTDRVIAVPSGKDFQEAITRECFTFDDCRQMLGVSSDMSNQQRFIVDCVLKAILEMRGDEQRCGRLTMATEGSAGQHPTAVPHPTHRCEKHGTVYIIDISSDVKRTPEHRRSYCMDCLIDLFDALLPLELEAIDGETTTLAEGAEGET